MRSSTAGMVYDGSLCRALVSGWSMIVAGKDGFQAMLRPNVRLSCETAFSTFRRGV